MPRLLHPHLASASLGWSEWRQKDFRRAPRARPRRAHASVRRAGPQRVQRIGSVHVLPWCTAPASYPGVDQPGGASSRRSPFRMRRPSRARPCLPRARLPLARARRRCPRLVGGERDPVASPRWRPSRRDAGLRPPRPGGSVALHATKVACNTTRVAHDVIQLPCNATKVPCNATKVPCNRTKVPCNATKVPCNATKVPCNARGISRATQPESHATQPGSRATSPGLHATQPGSHATRPRSRCTGPESHATEPWSRATASRWNALKFKVVRNTT